MTCLGGCRHVGADPNLPVAGLKSTGKDGVPQSGRCVADGEWALLAQMTYAVRTRLGRWARECRAIVAVIFISYRRDDSAGHAGRLLDHLSATFGAKGVFMDIDAIRRGDRFADTLNSRLKAADVLLAVIGKQWLTLRNDADERRLDAADDWVCTEIAHGLEAGLLVIPVLVGGATLPSLADLPQSIRLLAGRQKADVHDGTFREDVAALCADIKRRRAGPGWAERARTHALPLAGVAIVAAAGVSYYINSAGGRATVPPLTGMVLEQATRAVEVAGLHVGRVTSRASNRSTVGTVLEQTPAASTALPRGSQVELVVAEQRAVDLSRWVSIHDVGTEGTHAAMAVVTAMETTLAAQGQPMALSTRYLYEKSKRHDEVTGEGTYVLTSLYAAQRFGVPPESMWPYRSGEHELPAGATWQALDAAASAYLAQADNIKTLDAVLQSLDRQVPVVVAATLTNSWFAEPTVKSGQVHAPAKAEDEIGLAALVLIGFDPVTKRYRFAAPWGKQWGEGGFGLLHSDEAAAVLRLEQGLWAVSVAPARR